MTHQIELHLAGQLIQYEHSEVQKIPSWHSFIEGASDIENTLWAHCCYLGPDNADVVLFVDENTKPEDFVSWSQLFSAFDLRFFIWDCFQQEMCVTVTAIPYLI